MNLRVERLRESVADCSDNNLRLSILLRNFMFRSNLSVVLSVVNKSLIAYKLEVDCSVEKITCVGKSSGF
jgi:hypothetical protein